MNLRYSDEEEQFRTDLRAWLQEVVPGIGPAPDEDDWEGRRDYDVAWQKVLYEAGYAGIHWPEEYGGNGASPVEHLIFLEENERAGAPYVGMNFVGLLHAGPTLIAEASPEQQRRHLPAILKGDEVWCQGFSEPAAGSDLASLRTRAVLDGDEYVVNGQKIWTSFAHAADYCELLVRTDPDAPKHKGITWLILPMDTPGIDIRPLRTIRGGSEFSEVFLDDVRVPVANRVGDENDGWRIAMVTFSFERGTAFVSELVYSMQLVRDLAALAKELPRASAREGSNRGGLPARSFERRESRGTQRTAWDDDGLRHELGAVAAEFDALWALTKRNVSQAAREGVPGIGGSVFKLHYAEMRHRLGNLADRILERGSLSLDDLDGLAVGAHVKGRIHAMSLSIAAGTTQVQRNIIGERILGLPKEPPVSASG